MKWIGDTNMQKKKCFDTIYIIFYFFLKIVMGNLKLWLVVTRVENKYCTEKGHYM